MKLDEHAFVGAPATLDTTGQTGAEVDEAERADRPAARVDAIVRAWSAMCELPSYGSCAITFEDPRTIVRAVLASALVPADRSAIEQLERSVLEFRIHPSVAVVQLVALSRVLHRSSSALPGAVGGTRIDLEVDRAINLAIAGLLDDLEQRGLVDPLTGLLNRRALDRDLVELIQSSARHDRCLAVVMSDLDGLKATNDSLGHAAGDERLRGAARTLASALRTGDNVYRIGGDEFVILMPDVEHRNLEAVVGRVDASTATSLTWGLAWARIMPDVDAADEAARLLELADQRLLRYRWSGTNEPITRAPGGEIVAGRFGPPFEQPPRRR